LAVLRKGAGTDYYENLIRFIQEARDAAVARSQTPKVLWVNFAHGEQDTGDGLSAADYKTGMNGLWTEFNTEVKTITGQTEDVIFIMQQTGRLKDGVMGGPAQATLELALEQPDKFRSIGPNFMLTDWADTQHLTARGYYRKAHAFAEACSDLLHFERVKVPPVAFVQAKKTAARTIDLVGHPHWGPVYADTSVVSDPGNYGIEVLSSGGSALLIESVTWVDNVVTVTMAADLAAGPSVRIAGSSGNSQQGPTTGARTPLRVAGDVNCMDGYAMGRYFHHQQLTVEE
jgi:hypothetical protein